MALGTRFKEPDQIIRSLNIRGLGRSEQDVLLAAMYGLTTITQQCTACGWVTAENVPGKIVGVTLGEPVAR